MISLVGRSGVVADESCFEIVETIGAKGFPDDEGEGEMCVGGGVPDRSTKRFVRSKVWQNVCSSVGASDGDVADPRGVRCGTAVSTLATGFLGRDVKECISK
jgi:hypothetical protein